MKTILTTALICCSTITLAEEVRVPYVRDMAYQSDGTLVLATVDTVLTIDKDGTRKRLTENQGYRKVVVSKDDQIAAIADSENAAGETMLFFPNAKAITKFAKKDIARIRWEGNQLLVLCTSIEKKDILFSKYVPNESGTYIESEIEGRGPTFDLYIDASPVYLQEYRTEDNQRNKYELSWKGKSVRPIGNTSPSPHAFCVHPKGLAAFSVMEAITIADMRQMKEVSSFAPAPFTPLKDPLDRLGMQPEMYIQALTFTPKGDAITYANARGEVATISIISFDGGGQKKIGVFPPVPLKMINRVK